MRKKKGNKNMLVAVIAIVVVVALIATIVLGGFLNTKAEKTEGSLSYLFPSLEKIKQRGSIIMATEASFIPFESFDTTNASYVGFDIDSGQQDQGETYLLWLGVPLSLDVRDVAFSGIPASLNSGQYDMSLSGMTITEERNQSVLFSTPYYLAEAGFGLLVKTTDNNLNSPDDLVNATSIVVNTGTTSELWVTENLINTGKYPAEKVKSLPTIAGCAQDVQVGQSEVFIIDKPTAEEYADLSNGVMKVSAVIPSYEPYGVALNKDSTDLKLIIDLLINKMYANGEMEQLRIKWGLN